MLRQLRRWIGTWTAFDWAWLAWLSIGIGIEAQALRDARAGGTLSDILWWLTSNNREARGHWRAMRIVALCLTCWAVFHVWMKRNWV